MVLPVGKANLSRGMQQRLAIAQNLMAEPALLLYDEPFTSLDAGGREVLREVITACREVTIQLAITHERRISQGWDTGNSGWKTGA